jgi:hypothetical protein
MFSGVSASLKSAGFGGGIALLDAGVLAAELGTDGLVGPPLGGEGTGASVVRDRKRPPRRGLEGDERSEICDELPGGAGVGVSVADRSICSGGTGGGRC